MRQTTKRKFYAKSNVAQSVRSAVNEIAESVKIVSQMPVQSPLVVSLNKVIRNLQNAVEWEQTYGLGRKRIKANLETLKVELEKLLQDVMAIPVTQDEKILARAKRNVVKPKPVPQVLSVPVKESKEIVKTVKPKVIKKKSEVKKKSALSKIQTRKVQPGNRARRPDLHSKEPDKTKPNRTRVPVLRS